MTTRVEIVGSRFGGVLSELAAMLLGAVQRAGHDASIVLGDERHLGHSSTVVLLGAGVEFDGVLSSLVHQRARPKVVLWALDPFPPPHLTSTALTRGMRAGRRTNRFRRIGDRTGGGGRRLGRAGRVARSIAIGMASAGRLSPNDAFAFERLDRVLLAHRAGRIDGIFASSPSAVRVLGSVGVPASYLPVPFDPAMGADLGRDRDLDAVFIGSTRDGRAAQVRRLTAALDDAGIGFEVVDRDCFGDDRAALLNRARVSINLHKFPWHLERTRLHLSMACGSAVVSELPVPDPDPFEVGRHLDAAPFASLAGAVASLVHDDARRRRMVDEATRLLHDGPTMDGAAARLLAS